MQQYKHPIGIHVGLSYEPFLLMKCLAYCSMKGLKIKSLDPCISFKLLLHNIPYLFRSVLYKNGVENSSINRLKKIVLHFKIFYFRVISLLLLCFCLCCVAYCRNIAKLG